jgi:hypothetical protein
VAKHPGQLGGGEVRIDHQPGDRAHAVFMTGLAQSYAIGGGAAVLPNDRASERLQRAPIPHHERLALVGDPDRADIARHSARGGERLTRAVLHGRPDLVSVVLDPAGLREMLRDLLVALADYIAVHADGY